MRAASETRWKILRALANDARLSPATLAAMAGIDEATAAAEITHCEREGIIRRYRFCLAK